MRVFTTKLGLFSLRYPALVGAASSRDKPWQHGVNAIFAAGSRSHQVKAIFL